MEGVDPGRRSSGRVAVMLNNNPFDGWEEQLGIIATATDSPTCAGRGGEEEVE